MKRTFKIQSGIYKIVNKDNGKVYIGCSTCILFRWQMHRENLRRRVHSNRYLQKDWNLYGPSIFEFSLIEYVPFMNDLLKREKYWIHRYKNSGEIYNIVV
jgi:group I intron endonuclease